MLRVACAWQLLITFIKCFFRAIANALHRRLGNIEIWILEVLVHWSSPVFFSTWRDSATVPTEGVERDDWEVGSDEYFRSRITSVFEKAIWVILTKVCKTSFCSLPI
uniref:Putative secreted protein n=1 Tax=Ixodes ricinus TaxID=34613 RepID=A0A6B0U9I2_IXORI